VCKKLTYLEKCFISDTGTRSLQDERKEFMVLVPTDKVLQITLDYLANDPELHEIFVYIQSEEFPKIHTNVEHIKEHKCECLYVYVLQASI
jgi:hypothetical protein